MTYPVTLTFKLLALAPQIQVRDATGALLCYVRQKLFRLKEAVTVYRDEAQEEPVYLIQADRIIDIGATYHFSTPEGRPAGALRQHGLRSFWKARYDILDGDRAEFVLQEENPWVKVLDGFLGEIPILGLLTGYMLNPTYLVEAADGTPAFHIRKSRAFLESRFTVQKLAELEPAQEMRVLLAVLTMVLLERSRG
jgi:uncharacterized protein YxjI